MKIRQLISRITLCIVGSSLLWQQTAHPASFITRDDAEKKISTAVVAFIKKHYKNKTKPLLGDVFENCINQELDAQTILDNNNVQTITTNDVNNIISKAKEYLISKNKNLIDPSKQQQKKDKGKKDLFKKLLYEAIADNKI